MKLNIAVLPGDGIGPEIMPQALHVLDAVAKKFNHEFTYHEAICGAHAIDAVGDPFPDETFKTCMDADAVLFAAVGDPRFDNDPTLKVRPETGLLAMRKKLGLFANVRPVATFDCLLHKSPLKEELIKGADFVVIRELTGGMYFGEKYQDDEKAYDTDIYHRSEIERILKVAFEFAERRNHHLTVVDKAKTICSSTTARCACSPSLASSMSSSQRTPSATFSPTRRVPSRAPWVSSHLLLLASTPRSSSLYTAHGLRQQVRTSLTHWHRSSPQP